METATATVAQLEHGEVAILEVDAQRSLVLSVVAEHLLLAAPSRRKSVAYARILIEVKSLPFLIIHDLRRGTALEIIGRNDVIFQQMLDVILEAVGGRRHRAGPRLPAPRAARPPCG